jgi:3-oxoacyl-[acyl-carrier protein] reductase
MNDKIVLITGASRGLGASVAGAFGDTGAHVVGCARDTDDLEGTVTAIENAGGTITTMQADVRDEDEIWQVPDYAAREFEGIDVIVANAGINCGEPGRWLFPTRPTRCSI